MTPHNKPARVKVFGTGETIEVAPGVTTAPLPVVTVPRVAVARLQPVGGGDYRPVVKVLGVWARLTLHLPQELGLKISYSVLRRLALAQFVESRQPSPCCFEINLESLEKHLEACTDPEFWTPEKRRRYIEACD
ncbi:MAG: hypothetical protein PHI35_00700 [Victivallaceae bacterium]|nr:hypothetical protein [Victivallaceae bacterium]